MERVWLKARLLCAAAVLLAAAWASPPAADAQCALCRTSLQQAGAKAASTMNLAIIVLLIPPVSIFCTIFAVAYRKRKGGSEGEGSDGGRR